MEHSEIDLAPISNGEQPQLVSHEDSSSPVVDHSPPSDLNQTAENHIDHDDALAVELHDKLDLKIEDERVVETDDKVSNFNDGGEVCVEEESVKGEVVVVEEEE
ncbi:zinc finger CCCH domain-containing protein, partial [Trifolium pratense]